MIIHDLRKEKPSTFDELELGSIFKYKGELYMKTGNSPEGASAYDFCNGCLKNFSVDDKVVYIPSELILHGNDWESKDKYK